MASRRRRLEFRRGLGRTQRRPRRWPWRSRSARPRWTVVTVASPSRDPSPLPHRRRATAPRRRGRSSASSDVAASSDDGESTGGIDERRGGLMAAVVWFTVAIALWHFTVFVPDRFWAGIVGALLGAIAGGMISGAIVHIASGRSIGDTDIGTVLVAMPGTLIGVAIIYAIGVRRERLAGIE